MGITSQPWKDQAMIFWGGYNNGTGVTYAEKLSDLVRYVIKIKSIFNIDVYQSLCSNNNLTTIALTAPSSTTILLPGLVEFTDVIDLVHDCQHDGMKGKED